MDNRNASLLGIVLAIALAAAPAAAIETVGDLDLLASGNVPPNVMLIFDNSSSMRTALGTSDRVDVAHDAMVDLINALYPDDGSGGYKATVRLGLTDFSSSCQGANRLVNIGSTNKSALLSGVDGIKTSVDSGYGTNCTPLSETLVDVGRYFAGQYGFGDYPSVSNTSPIDLECRENFVVIMTDGDPTFDQNNYYGSAVWGTTAYSDFVNTIGNADGDANECSSLAPATCIDAPTTGRDDGVTYSFYGTDWLDDVAYYLANHDLVPDASLSGVQNVKTYTVGFTTASPLLDETAQNGQGQYFTATDASSLAASLQDTFSSIFKSVQGSFTSAVVPGSSLGLGNAFYNSYFLSSNDEPVWEGHLEALRITSTGQIVDANGDPAVDPSTGALVPTRVPFWDAATTLKTNTSRTMYTTKSNARVNFDNTNVDATDLGVTAPTYANYPNYPASGVNTVTGLVDALIGYVRGQDAFDQNNNGNTTEMRNIVFGDVFHSTPRAIAQPSRGLLAEPSFQTFFNTYAQRDRVVYAGANDAVLHAFDGGQFKTGDDPSTPEIEQQYYTPGTGAERFGYVPGAMLGKLKLLPQNAPRTQFFVDGPLSVADAWLGDGSGTDVTKSANEWATVMVAGYRKGGDGYLALDITDPNAASGDDHYPYPKLLWEFTDPDLGQSWSQAVITRVKLRTNSGGDHCGIPDVDGNCREQWVAIFAGGYEDAGDPNRPSVYVGNPSDASWSDQSKAIYMVALDSGQIIGKVKYDATTQPDMKFSIPSAPAVIDSNGDGFADVVYVGDLGGQVWKWDISAVGEDTSAPKDGIMDNWPAGVFFRTPGVTLTNGDTHYRSFFFPPVGSYVNGKLVLAFGSGERNNLTHEGDPNVADENRFYVITDNTPIGAGSIPATPYSESDLTDVTSLKTDTVPGDLGYYFSLPDSYKFVTDITVFAGYVIVGAYTPAAGLNLCDTSAGQSFLYVFNVATGAGFFSDPSTPPSEDRRTYIGGGFPTSPVVAVGNNSSDDTIIVKTSEGPNVITIGAPPRNQPKGQFIYWKQVF